MASLHVELASPPSASFPDTHLQVPHPFLFLFSHDDGDDNDDDNDEDYNDDDNAKQVGRDVKEFLHGEGIHSTTVQLEYHSDQRWFSQRSRSR